MADHQTGTREEWLAARLGLLEAEKELTRNSDKLAPAAAGAPLGPDRQEVSVRDRRGERLLKDLFRGRSQLLVYHFMFGYGSRLTDERRGCTGCPWSPITLTVSFPT